MTRRITSLFAVLWVTVSSAHEQAPKKLLNVTAQTVEVIGTSPLPGHGVDRDLLPYNTQLIIRNDIRRSGSEHLTDLLGRSSAGVQVNEVQGSPYQGDLTFRGFRASGLLGAAQGLSVYLDGVRINEPFGDVVNWDLLPEFALDSLALVPGANPAFGLNTLGGAIALRTVDGSSAPGVQAEARVGSFGRRHLNLAHGGSGDGWQHYVGLGLFEEDGWRDFSPGRLATGLAKTSVRTDAGEFGASLLAGRSTLVGNGLVPLYTFEEPDEREPDLGADRSAVYTHPDRTAQRLTQLALSWRLALDADTTAEALAYSRRTRRETVNGDEADEFDPDEPEVNASFNRTATRQSGQGMALGVSSRSGTHQWQVGLALDRARVRYEQTEQEGSFDSTRGVLPIEDEEPELSAAVSGRSTQWGLYASDTWQIAAGTHLTGTLRWNQARVSNRLTRVDDDTGDVEERPEETFTYRHWNPALGLAHRLVGTRTTLFANVARNTRVPTVIELGCADPDEPCRLPAGLQADPYLKPVRSTTLEAGLRHGGRGPGHGGNLTLFRTDNRDDILFSSVSLTGQLGYFRNFDRTRHQGLDAEWRWRGGPWQLGLGLSLLDATYQAEGVLRIGERNVEVGPGTRIAGLPRRMLKAHVQWASGAWRLGGDLQAVSRRGVAGNEDGRFDDDEEESADFSIPGYAIVNLQANWSPAAGLEIFARIHNLANRRTASFGALAETQFDADGNFAGDEADALFVAPGAPRSVVVGLRWAF
jgi:outer membrane receptor protein involved in Fe transport